jgi:ABC-type polysaccharide/polyol phosphate export permease
MKLQRGTGLSAKASSAKPGSLLETVLGSLATFYNQRWLIKYLVQRQMASNYRQSYLGLVWSFLSPLLMVVLFTIVFSELLGVRFRELTGDSSLNFGLYLYCGLLPFLAFQGTLNQGVTIIPRNSDLVERVVFPLEILPLSVSLTSLILNFVGVPAIMLVFLVLEQRLEWTAVRLPLIMVPQLLFTLGLSYLMAVAGTYVPDTRETLRGMVRAMFFVTPIFWPPEMAPESLRFLVDYNPLAFLVEAYRDLILNGELPGAVATSYFYLFAVALFAVGIVVFDRAKQNFVDML